ncbi:MAG: hypothetical protein ACJ8EB_07825, partial [Allosphingosinicella sp.]
VRLARARAGGVEMPFAVAHDPSVPFVSGEQRPLGEAVPKGTVTFPHGEPGTVTFPHVGVRPTPTFGKVTVPSTPLRPSEK